MLEAIPVKPLLHPAYLVLLSIILVQPSSVSKTYQHSHNNNYYVLTVINIVPLVSDLVMPMTTMDPPTTTVINLVMTETVSPPPPPPSKFFKI